jgi:ADP-ribose pyrophosphatase YjhB (NUDIX family)
MEQQTEPRWLAWAKELQALAQTGLTYAQDGYDRERYARLSELAAEMLAEGAGLDVPAARALFAGETGHATPKLDVRGVVFREGRILLVRERSDGRWTLPGGWADPGESPAEATVREVYEESGYRTRAVKLLALYDRSRHGHGPHPYYIYKVFFQCALLGEAGESHIGRRDVPATHQETDGVDFFAPDALPALSQGRVTEAQIARLFEHARHPEWPADFD